MAKKKKAESKPAVNAKDEVLTDEKLEEEAKTLGLKKSRTSVAGSRVKDKPAEIVRCAKKANSRLRKDVARVKAEAKLTVEEKRKRLLTARLNNSNNQYTKEQIRQFKAELHAIKTGQWFAPTTDAEGKIIAWKVPKQPSNYDKFMAS